MITNRELELVLERALQGRGDFAEIFLEDTEEYQLNAIGLQINGMKKVRIYGAGLYLLSGTDSIYVYTNNINFDSLMNLAAAAANLLEAGTTQNEKVLSSARRTRCIPLNMQGSNLFDVSYTGSHGDFVQKERLIQNAVWAGMSAGPEVKSLNIGYYDTDQRIRIANSEGLLVDDRRQNARLRTHAVVGDGINNCSRWNDVFRAGTFQDFMQSDEYTAAIQAQVHKMECARRGRPVSKCTVPVILEAGVGATFFHECCGHMLEGCAVVSKESPYANMVGKQVASEKITLVDDGTVSGQIGSSKIDDEGHPRQKNVLIENGILKGFLNDRLCGRILGTGSTGSGRRQNYMYAPACRMSNTFVLPGNDDPEDIIKSIDRGILVSGINGGNGGAQFTIMVDDAFWIENGQIADPLKPFSITGNGIAMMKKIDKVGTQLGTYDGAFCGAASGLIPTTTNQPRIRIADLDIG